MIFETERLEFHQLSLKDVDFIIDLLNSPGWLKYIGDRGIKTQADAIDYLMMGPLKSYHDHGFGLWLVKLKETNAPIGMCGLIKRDYLEDVDIGFAFLPQYIGKGYGYEAAKATLDYAKSQYHLKRIVAITSKDNQPSISLLQKIGLHFEKVISIPNDPEELNFFTTSKEFSN